MVRSHRSVVQDAQCWTIHMHKYHTSPRYAYQRKYTCVFSVLTGIFFALNYSHNNAIRSIHIAHSTYVCSRSLARNKHKSTDHSLHFSFLFVDHVAPPEFLNSKQSHDAIVCLLGFMSALETKWNHPFAAAINESLCAIDMQPVARHYRLARSFILPAAC